LTLSLPEGYQTGAREHHRQVKYERRDYSRDGGESFRTRGDRHDDVNGSTDARQQEKPAQNIENNLHLQPPVSFDKLGDRLQEHPEGQDGRDAMNAVADDRVLAPGLFFSAEHAR
jgi:hypothetical protein